VRRWALWTLALAVIVGGGSLLATWAVPGEAVARAVWTSPAITFVVQLGTFGLARGAQRTNVMAGWGAGMVIRFLALAVYALLVVRRLGLAPAPALLSLAAFLFVSTIVEPVLLKP